MWQLLYLDVRALVRLLVSGGQRSWFHHPVSRKGRQCWSPSQPCPQQLGEPLLHLSEWAELQTSSPTQGDLIADAEPTLVSSELLQKALGPLAALKSAVEQYASIGNPTFLTNAEGSLDALIAEVGWPRAYSFKKSIDIRQYAGAYHDARDNNLPEARQQVDQLTAQIADLGASVVHAVWMFVADIFAAAVPVIPFAIAVDDSGHPGDADSARFEGAAVPADLIRRIRGGA